MPERMLFIRGLSRHFEADDGYRVAAAVGQVVQPVRKYGQHAGHGTRRDLSRREQHVEPDAQISCKFSVPLPRFRVGSGLQSL